MFKVSMFLILVGVATPVVADKSIPLHVPLSLDCGIYQISGVLKENTRGDTLLSLRHGTTSTIQFIVVSEKTDEIKRRLGLPTKIEVYVPQKIVSNNSPFVIVRKFQTSSFGLKDEIIFKRKSKCGDKKNL